MVKEIELSNAHIALARVTPPAGSKNLYAGVVVRAAGSSMYTEGQRVVYRLDPTNCVLEFDNTTCDVISDTQVVGVVPRSE
jgi:hypothetical protein